MSKPFETWPTTPDESLAVPGPDYVALVIEWDEPPEEDAQAADAATPDTMADTSRSDLAHGPVRPRRFAQALAVAVALGAFLLATWGVRRRRHA